MSKQLIRLVQVSSVILLLIVATLSRARADEHSLTDQITHLLDNTTNLPPPLRPSLEITLLTPRQQLATLCEQPVLSLSGNPGRLAGLHTLQAQCGTKRRFLQIRVNAIGTWWQAAHQIERGATVTLQDIRPRQGSLEHLPAGLISDAHTIIGSVALRTLHPGENLVEGQFRQRWVINAGDKVEISYQGAGFTISATAKALDNAALAQRLRLKTASGRLLTATATGNNHAVVPAG